MMINKLCSLDRAGSDGAVSASRPFLRESKFCIP